MHRPIRSPETNLDHRKSPDPQSNRNGPRRYQVLHSVQIPVRRVSELKAAAPIINLLDEKTDQKSMARGRSRRKQQPQPAPKTNIDIPVALSRTVPYPVYSCKWGRCQAELHNLGMLKKHVVRVHFSGDRHGDGGSDDGQLRPSCQWEECSYSHASNPSDLCAHVMDEHIEPIAWRLGDGPFVPETDNEKDSSGRTILHRLDSRDTLPNGPIPSGEEDSLVLPASHMSVCAFNQVHGNHSQQEKAREVLRAVQRLKCQVGVGLDPGGCELATPARHWNLSDEEEVYRLVKNDE